MASKRRKRNPPCCGCKQIKRESYRRGLCGTCAARAYAAVNDGITTWEALEEAGLAKPSQRGQPRTPLSKKIAALAAAHG